MHRHFTLTIAIILLTACKPSNSPEETREKVPVDKNLRVVIKNALSDKVDVMKGVYTVFFVGKQPIEVKFELTPAEKELIINKYYSLALYALKEVDAHWGTIYIEDDCMVMPKIYTYLTVERDSITQHVQIDEACDEYSHSKRETAQRVKTFLDFVNGIIKAKPAVKNAPKSDIFYI
jgi:hypothetical protein